MDKPDGPLGPDPVPCRLGQVVRSTKGKDRGRLYVVVGFLDGNRLALADAERFNVLQPKKKNPRHVQVTPQCAACLLYTSDAADEL